ncbi:MAG TPA: EamA family transporter [Candidatus Acidoferrales bacterium]|nr:EamA family transporter [Candidatus Acidoferrales bacterium]
MSLSRQGGYRASPWAIWVALAAVYLIWGSTYLAIRYAVETLPPFLMAGVRFIVSGAFLYALRRARGDPAPQARQWASATIIGTLLLVGGNGGVSWAEQFVASGLVALLVATVPLWMVLLDALRPGGRLPGLRVAAGILIGFAGVVTLVGGEQARSHSEDVIGAWVVVGASLLWALGSLFGRAADLPRSPLLGTSMEMLTGGAALIVLGTLAGEWQELHLAQASARSFLALGYLVVFGSTGFAAYVWLLRVAPTPLVATYAYVNPLVAVLLGYLLAAEPLTARTLFAAAAIVGSVALVSGSAAGGEPRGQKRSLDPKEKISAGKPPTL